MNDELKNEVLAGIDGVYKNEDCKYAIWNYVARDFWVDSFKNLFSEMYFYNETDFNYSVCFTMYLNLSAINATFYSREFDYYLREKGSIDLLLIHISAIAPYATIKYLQYKIVDGEKKIFSRYTSSKPEHAQYGSKLKQSLKDRNIICLEDDILLLKVEGISLELRENDVRVYNCLFEDSEGWPK